MDFDFAGLRQSARQTEHLRANRCLIYGQTVLHFESGLLFSWPLFGSPLRALSQSERRLSLPLSPAPDEIDPGLAKVESALPQHRCYSVQRESPAQKPERSIAD